MHCAVRTLRSCTYVLHGVFNIWLDNSCTVVPAFNAGASAGFFPDGAKNSDFDHKSLHLPKCLLSVNNNDIIVYN